MVDIIALPVADSISEHSPRLHTQRWRHPKFNHQEALRHRTVYIQDNLSLSYDPDFSFSVSSARAIPFPKTLQEVRDPLLAAAPIYWGEAQRGMSPGGELDDTDPCVDWTAIIGRIGLDTLVQAPVMVTKRQCAVRLWHLGLNLSSQCAELMVEFTDVHKSVVNRMIEFGLHVNCLATGTEPGWMNFFGLRLDEAADPTLRALAEQSWIAWNQVEPVVLEPGQWHLPFAKDSVSLTEAVNYHSERGELVHDRDDGPDILETLKKMSVARCAHLSHEALDTGQRLLVERCFDIVSRLNPGRDKPLHASPFEHQAQVDEWYPSQYVDTPSHVHDRGFYARPHLSGNLGPGWVQLRKLLPGEKVAPLPEAYRVPTSS